VSTQAALVPAVELPSLLPSALLAGPGDAVDGGRRRRTVRDWLVDVTCFLLSLGLGALLVAADDASRHPASTALRVADVVTGLICCVALWWRRRWPVWLAVLTLPAGAFSAMSAVAVTILAFTVAVHRKAWIAVVVAVAGCATTPVYWSLRGRSEEPLWANIVFSVLVTGVVLGWGQFTRARRQLVGSLRDRALRAETEQQLRVDQARRMERARIAREMHDVLAHRISLLSVHAGALEFRTDASREQMVEAAGVIRANAHQALQDLREVIGVLREDDTGLAIGAGAGGAAAGQDAPEPPRLGLAEIPALIAESTASGARVRYRCELDRADGVPQSVARTGYRVVQEGLTNARKHAPGVPIDVRVSGSPRSGLTIEISNPTPVWPPVSTVPGSGLGLIGLAERVQLAGGRLEHGTEDGARFLLRARLPWRR
jgi:signal transduction histidine kinase